MQKNDKFAELRKKAEQILTGKKSREKISDTDYEKIKMLHELEVHQVELQMQNEELLNSKNDVELLLKKFTFLYEFAPIGYFTINFSGDIFQVNLSGAKLLRVGREHLVNSNFKHCVSKDYTEEFDNFIESIYENKREASCEIALTLLNGETKFVYIEGIYLEEDNNILMNVFDITVRKKFEELIKNYNTELENTVKDKTAELININLDLQNEVRERTKIYNSLRGSEEKFRQIVETANEGIVLTKPEGSFYYVNQKMADFLGYKPEEIIGKSALDFTFSDFKIQVFKDRNSLIKNKNLSGQFKFRRKDGSEFWTSFNATAIFDKDDKHIANLIMYTDITDQKKAEKTIHNIQFEIMKEKNRLETVISTMPVGICIIELDDNGFFKTNRSNLKYEQIWGKERLRSRSIEDYNKYKAWWVDSGKPVETGEWASAIALNTGKTVSGQILKIKSFDGKDVYIHNSATPIKDAKGNVKGCVIASQDITEYMTAQENLKRSEEKLLAIYSSMTEGMAQHEIIFNESGDATDYVITDVNPAFEKICGISKNDAIGKKASEIFGTGKPPYFDIYKNVALIGEPHTFETFFAPMEKYFKISVFSPAKNSFATIFEDITERKVTEQLLLEREAEKKVAEALTYERQRLNDVLEELPVMVCLLKPDMQVSFANQRFRKHFGEDITRCCYDFLFNKKKPCSVCPFFDDKKINTQNHWEGFVDGYYYDVYVYPFTDPDGTPLVLEMIVDITFRKQLESQLRELAHNIQSVREEERTSISRMLHDSFGQSLTGLKMSISTIEHKIKKHENIQAKNGILDEIKYLRNLVDELAVTTSKLSMELRPNILDMLGLLPAIEWLVEDFSKKSGIKFQINSEVKELNIGSQFSTEVFRILQEILTNIIRHAKATKGTIDIYIKNDKYIIDVKDNGIGIKQDSINSAYSLGILGMKERTSIFGGHIEFSNYEKQGTKVSIEIPMTNK